MHFLDDDYGGAPHSPAKTNYCSERREFHPGKMGECRAVCGGFSFIPSSLVAVGCIAALLDMRSIVVRTRLPLSPGKVAQNLSSAARKKGILLRTSTVSEVNPTLRRHTYIKGGVRYKSKNRKGETGARTHTYIQ